MYDKHFKVGGSISRSMADMMEIERTALVDERSDQTNRRVHDAVLIRI